MREPFEPVAHPEDRLDRDEALDTALVDDDTDDAGEAIDAAVAPAQAEDDAEAGGAVEVGRSVPTLEDLSSQIELFFGPDGPLAAALPGYETRPEQVQIALAAAETMVSGRQLLAEAGTGTGKTLAYLVPAVLSRRRFVVSTATKNLQDQIVREDAPLLARALDRPLDVQVMKGRSNYLCLARLRQAAAQPDLPGIDDPSLLPLIAAWARESPTGDRAELTFLPDHAVVWREVSATSEQCTGRACPTYDRCFVTEMRRRAQTAAIVVVNHHLYMADLALRERAGAGGSTGAVLIPPHEVVIFDEAHELEEVSAQHFGCEVSDRRIQELCRDILRAVAAEPALAPRFTRVCGGLELEARRFFDALPWVEVRTLLPSEVAGDVALAWRSLDQKLAALEAELDGAAHEEAQLLARRTAMLAADLAFALGVDARPSCVTETVSVPVTGTVVDRSAEFSQLDAEEAAAEPHTEASRAPAPRYVRYTEKLGKTRAVAARPIDVAPILEAQLGSMPALFVSATLSVRGDFRHIRRRLGIGDAAEVVVDSPFDYPSQAALYLPQDLPEPDEAAFTSAAAARAAALVGASGGGAFVLCTSHRALAAMRETLAYLPQPLLVQGQAPKTQLLEEFKENGDAVLLATMSFWQGVDVPGRALRLVIIDKLPFASPADPLTAARLAHLREQGYDPFTTYQVPQAALLLRQGFGRLIRRRSDRGLVAVFDRRLTQRRYGRLLLDSLPACPRLDSLAAAQRFLAQAADDYVVGFEYPSAATVLPSRRSE